MSERTFYPFFKVRGSNWRIVFAACAITLTVLAAFFLSRYGAHSKVQEQFYGQILEPAQEGYDFRLIDQNGKAFQLSQLRGKVVLFSFGYTHCPDVCPTTLTDFGKIYRALSENDRKRVQVLFISVDSRRDQPETLKNYIPYFDASFLGLTGDANQINEATKAYGASYEFVHHPGEDPDVYFVNHSAYAYLIDPEGKWKAIYDFDQLRETGKVAADIRRVLKSS
jgi:protein SCO1/2